MKKNNCSIVLLLIRNSSLLAIVIYILRLRKYYYRLHFYLLSQRNEVFYLSMTQHWLRKVNFFNIFEKKKIFIDSKIFVFAFKYI